MTSPRKFSRHHESSASIPASADRVFAVVDDHSRLSSHMTKRSWKMGGGRMAVTLDQDRGQLVGSRIRLGGRIFGVWLAVEEVITERDPPRRKVWETTGQPRLLVVGHYRMGFEITPQRDGAHLRVFIDYALPEKAPARWLGYLLGRYYARWCTDRMVRDAAKHLVSAGFEEG
jgi:hypothetical protein